MVSNLSFPEALLQGFLSLGASEPISLFILWLGSILKIDKTIYISLINGLFSSLIYLFFARFDCRFFTPLLFFNFYFLVLITSTERLKIAFVFLLISILTERKRSILFYFLSIFNHLQLILFLPTLVINNQINSIKLFLTKFSIFKKDILRLLIIFIITIFVLALSYTSIAVKIGYLQEFELKEFASNSIITFILLSGSRNKFNSFLLILPFILISPFIGAGRTIIMTFSLTTYILAREKRLLNPFYILINLYLIIKFFIAVDSIVKYGDIFYLAN
ncbi:hypothetical protein [uncultured Prochlorococcus sp.]|uniref:hypothetical protein n=1 Tax=uncultured Prochlorococcus sp. TaxID=159733 RepID=UPI0025866737|nr:hypothetical protein [uncultured Prochlorococcus sp.]